jgi:hypothetical protein
MVMNVMVMNVMVIVTVIWKCAAVLWLKFGLMFFCAVCCAACEHALQP